MDIPREIPANAFYGRRFQHLEDALDEIENIPNRNEIDLVIIPPEPNIISDDEEFDEDDLASAIYPKDVPGSIEIHVSDVDSEEDEIQETHNKRPRMMNKEMPSWTSDIIDINMQSTDGYIQRLQKLKDELFGMNEIQIFQKIFDAEVFNHIVEHTNLYARQQNNHSFSVSTSDIQIFIAVQLFSGYHSLARERLFWCLDEDTRIPFVADRMSRNRFQEIKKYLHLADNSKIDKTDKMFKVRSLSNLLNKKFQQWGVFHQNLSIDESMVKYFGHHPSKQFIRGKPVRFGYKNWLMCSADGFCYNFDTYCGAKTYEKTNATLPLGSKVVLDLLKIVEFQSDHIIFFDNYFTSYDLMKMLQNRNFRAMGTVRENRTKKCPLTASKMLKKKERGYYEHQTDKNNKILFVRWKDNSVVTIATNYGSVVPVGAVKRWSSIKKQKVDVPQPAPFSHYNSGMGGVDSHDQFTNNYRIAVRGKKWWWVLFTQMVNMSVVNAWKLHKLVSEDDVDLLSFQRTLTRHYMRCNEKSVFKKSNPKPMVPKSIVQHDGGHFPQRISNPLRCRQCHQRIRWICEKCNVALCVERCCFKTFHTQSTS